MPLVGGIYQAEELIFVPCDDLKGLANHRIVPSRKRTANVRLQPNTFHPQRMKVADLEGHTVVDVRAI